LAHDGFILFLIILLKTDFYQTLFSLFERGINSVKPNAILGSDSSLSLLFVSILDLLFRSNGDNHNDEDDDGGGRQQRWKIATKKCLIPPPHNSCSPDHWARSWLNNIEVAQQNYRFNAHWSKI
jgi:hypothetical protein